MMGYYWLYIIWAPATLIPPAPTAFPSTYSMRRGFDATLTRPDP